MKLTRAVLLSILITVGILGTDASVSFGSQAPTGRVPKEPPSTTLVVHGATPLSIATTTPAEVTTLNPAQTANRVLTAKYSFNERGPRVRKLQRAIGAKHVDGHYGPKTRAKHVAKLHAMGLPTDNVPPAVTAPRYNISTDKTKRCPQFEAAFTQHGLLPVEVFSYLAWRESRCNPAAVNAKWKNGRIVWTLNKDGSYDSGLLQINSSWTTVTSQVCNSKWGNMQVLLDLDCNLRVAKFLLDNTDSGLGNWLIRRIN